MSWPKYKRCETCVFFINTHYPERTITVLDETHVIDGYDDSRCRWEPTDVHIPYPTDYWCGQWQPNHEAMTEEDQVACDKDMEGK